MGAGFGQQFLGCSLSLCVQEWIDFFWLLWVCQEASRWDRNIIIDAAGSVGNGVGMFSQGWAELCIKTNPLDKCGQASPQNFWLHLSIPWNYRVSFSIVGLQQLCWLRRARGGIKSSIFEQADLSQDFGSSEAEYFNLDTQSSIRFFTAVADKAVA